MQNNLLFDPFIATKWLILFSICGSILIIFALFLRKKGSIFRLLSFLFLLLFLLNPKWQEKQTEDLPGIVAIIVDKSESQKLSHHLRETENILQQLKEKIKQYPQLEFRVLEVKNKELNNYSQTNLFESLSQLITDVPIESIAGAVFITDGQVHDIPNSCSNFSFPAPLNALIVGNQNEFDRVLKIVDAQSFNLLNQDTSLSFLVEDQGKAPETSELIKVSLSINGKIEPQVYFVKRNEKKTIKFRLPQRGKNIIELSTEEIPGELTDINNRAVSAINGIRENLRVLLISGEPYNGERLWRNLLKSDPNIDLVHFTILRSPEKADNTPENEMSLVVFPITDLFVNKIKTFDLVVLDRYQHYRILPKLYYEFIANYVKDGGALLMITGDEFNGANSLANSPLLSILPVYPSEKIDETPFVPKRSSAGSKHPITKNLDNSRPWGPWLRRVEVNNPNNNESLLEDDHHNPLLLAKHVDKGRLAILLSDESWLWARGFKGGGPYAALYRNMAHWLMKDLNEEELTSSIENNILTISRYTMKDKIEPVQITTPSGQIFSKELASKDKGEFFAKIPIDEFGIYKIKNGSFYNVSYTDGLNSPELSSFISTTKKLSPIVQCSGGSIIRVSQMQGKIPDIKFGTTSNPKFFLYLKKTQAKKTISVSDHSLFQNIFAFFLCLGTLIFAWYRESR